MVSSREIMLHQHLSCIYKKTACRRIPGVILNGSRHQGTSRPAYSACIPRFPCSNSLSSGIKILLHPPARPGSTHATHTEQHTALNHKEVSNAHATILQSLSMRGSSYHAHKLQCRIAGQPATWPLQISFSPEGSLQCCVRCGPPAAKQAACCCCCMLAAACTTTLRRCHQPSQAPTAVHAALLRPGAL